MTKYLCYGHVSKFFAFNRDSSSKWLSDFEAQRIVFCDF